MYALPAWGGFVLVEQANRIYLNSIAGSKPMKYNDKKL